MRNQLAAAVHNLVKDFEVRTDLTIHAINVERKVLASDFRPFEISRLKGVFIVTEL